jgi:hypothetical protein
MAVSKKLFCDNEIFYTEKSFDGKKKLKLQNNFCDKFQTNQWLMQQSLFLVILTIVIIFRSIYESF